MATREDVAIYLAKAVESLEGAESELANRRYNNCANRCYYACFQAAIAALLAAGIHARSARGHWRHQTIHATFVEQLINRQRTYPPSLRTVLATNLKMRQETDYETDNISEVQAHRAVLRSREFVNAIRQREGGTE